jgi:hypothetical protein
MTPQPTDDQTSLRDLWSAAPRRAEEYSQADVYQPEQYQPGEPYYPDANTPSRGVPARNWAVRRSFGSLFGELVLAVLICFGTAAGMGWHILRSARTVIPGNGADPFIELWSLGWSGHALKPGSGVGLAQLFNGNAFYPADYSLAFTDSLLGYGPITWLFHGASGLVLAYNLIFVFTPALSSLGGYLLARQLGAHPVGAAVAAAGFAYAPWHTGQFSHLHVLSIGPLAIALAMLARGHGFALSGRLPPIRPLWVLLGWLVAAWQLTIGFAGGLPFGYLLGGIGVLVLLIAPIRVIRARRAERPVRAHRQYDGYADTAELPPVRPRHTGWLVVTNVLGGAAFTAAGLFMAYPYLRVQRIDPAAVKAARGFAQVAVYSPTPADLIRPPRVDGTWSWLTDGHALASSGSNELYLLPGAILLVLAVLGLFVSTWRPLWRVLLALTGAAITALALGTHFPDKAFPGPHAPFLLLWAHAPGWAADRTPGRLMAFATLAVALLAAGFVSRICGWGVDGYRGRAPRLRSVLLAVVPVLVVLEGFAVIPRMAVPAAPKAVAAATGPMVVLPSVWTNDSKVMFWTTTRGYPEVANGQSGITPSTLKRMRAEMIGFPDARSVAYLRANGFHSVAVLKQSLGTPLWANAAKVPDPALGLTRKDLGDSVLFTVNPAKTS